MPSIESALHEFILSCQADGLSKNTVDWYRWLLTPFASAHAGQPIKEISTHDLRNYIQGLRAGDYTDNTISGHTRALHKFWGWVAKEYSIPSPMRSIRYPKKIQPQPRAVSLEDVHAMFQATGEGKAGVRDRAILAFLLDTGCRSGGLVGLMVSDVDLPGHRAIVTEKGNQTRAIVFTSYTAELLEAWMKQRHPAKSLFYNMETMEPLTRSGLRRLLERLAKRAGVKGRFNPHSFRHSFAREYLKAGGDLATLSKLLGHRDVSTTVSHYTVFTDREIAHRHEQLSPVKKLKPKDESEEK